MPLKTAEPEEPTLNLTPMIDVILTLVIFFMVASRFNDEEKALGVKVPTVSSSAAISAAPEPKVISVFSDGRVLLGKQTVSLDELTQQLKTCKEQNRRISVLVRGDRNAIYGHMTDVYEACKLAGISELSIAAKVDPKRR